MQMPKRTVKTYVRREGRITPGQTRGITQFWKIYGLDATTKIVDFSKIFPKDQPVIIEIGFGMGDSLVQMALENPQFNYLGIEVHRPGIGALLTNLAKHQLTNVRIYNNDALKILNLCIPDLSVSGFQIFFPDPWPKKRHHKRRLVQDQWMTLLYQKLKPNGFIHLATDIADYALQMLAVLSKIQGLLNQAEKDFIPRPQHRPLTKFEKRALKNGHPIFDLLFKKYLPLPLAREVARKVYFHRDNK